MRCDCHMHMILDGYEWKAAIARHAEKTDDAWIRQQIETYHQLGFTYLRDGGDRWGAGACARQLAPEYGICFRTPLSPLYKTGHYGSFIGTGFDDLRQYAMLVKSTREQGGDFIKIMISGLMDFNRFGILTEQPLPPEKIREMIRIAHCEGMAVMAHANGASALAAAEAGVDSIEHGAYLSPAALSAMAENRTVWVPTLSTIGNLRGTGRFDENAVAQILDGAIENIRRFASLGGLIAPGTDAGAYAVPHGSLTEYALLEQALGAQTDAVISRGIAAIRAKF